MAGSFAERNLVLEIPMQRGRCV